MSEDPSLHLNDSLESDFLRALDVSGLIGFFFSIEGTLDEVRQGKQLFCRIPQWSGVSLLSCPISSAWLAEISPVKNKVNSPQELSDFNIQKPIAIHLTRVHIWIGSESTEKSRLEATKCSFYQIRSGPSSLCIYHIWQFLTTSTT